MKKKILAVCGIVITISILLSLSAYEKNSCDPDVQANVEAITCTEDGVQCGYKNHGPTVNPASGRNYCGNTNSHGCSY